MSLEGAVGALVGAGIGSFFGNPLAGARYGYALGSALGADGPEDTFGPRLSDLKVQSSAYGAPIPIIYGKDRVSGNVIWAKPLRERKIEEDSGSKGSGGSTVTTYEYYASFAVALCDNEIAGVRKIWADSDLIYDVGDTASIETIQASNRNADKITIHYGTETQEADSLIQADKGVANTQAYRGTAYIVFDDLAVNKYGKRIPNITAEVISSGSEAIRLVGTLEKPTILENFNAAVTYIEPSFGQAFMFVGQWDNNYANGNIKYYISYSNGGLEEVATFSLGSTYQNILPGHSDKPALCVSERGTFVRDRVKLRIYDGESVEDACNFTTGDNDHKTANITSFSVDGDNLYLLYVTPTARYLWGGSIKEGSAAALLGDYAPLRLLHDDSTTLDSTTHSFAATGGIIYVLNNDNTIDKYDSDGVFIETVSFTPSPSIAYNIDGEGDPIIRVEDGIIYIIKDKALHQIDADGNYSYVGSIPTPGGKDYYGGFGGTLVKDGLLYQYRTGETSADLNGAFNVYHIGALTPGSVTLSSIVSDLDERAGLDATDDDTTALTDTVEGYVVTRPMSARKAIEPLQKAFFFDACEKDNVLTYVKRGGSVVANIPEVDLGAGDYGQDVDLFTLNREQDSELPAEIVVDYIDLNRSYQEGAQRAQRINSPQENVIKVSLPIVGTANYFKEVAHVLLYNAHTEREKFKLSLTGEYIDLNPTDVITFTADGDTRKVRITKITYGDTLMLDAVAEDVTVYSAESVAGDSETTEQSVGLEGPTKLYLMDIPLLRNQDNDAGMYVAASGYFSAWTGAGIFKSLDGGTSYSPVQDVLTGSVMGKATTALADANHTTFDRTSTVTVSLTSGTLSSSTESAVIQGANYALLGTEIIQFVNATDNGDGTYTLDTLLRGRRGTDWATGTHAVGDLFCLLRENVLERVGAVVNTERYYKAVSFGTYLDEAVAQAKTNTGVSQKPFSVKYIAHTRNGSNDIALSWTRRSRYIGTPLWNPPVFEDSESYKIEALSGEGGSVVNTYTSSTEDFTYLAADQTSDGFTPGDTIYFNIYQVGAVDGYDTEYEAA